MKRLTLDNAFEIAKEHGGICVSTEYINISTPMRWKCANSHEWTATLNNIKMLRDVSKYLGPPSKIRRPDFLKTPEYYQGLELDIPYYDYGFAIEVQGVQHEKYHEYFHGGDPNNLIKQQARDQLKKELCEKNQIALRYVWYYEDPFVVIPEHLRELGLIE
ncbi:19773_t:CDS:2 [Funneliformis geosporum]|nr:19773_t:CDS:2 [Funneliformis geosporum]